MRNLIVIQTPSKFNPLAPITIKWAKRMQEYAACVLISPNASLLTCARTLGIPHLINDTCSLSDILRGRNECLAELIEDRDIIIASPDFIYREDWLLPDMLKEMRENPASYICTTTSHKETDPHIYDAPRCLIGATAQARQLNKGRANVILQNSCCNFRYTGAYNLPDRNTLVSDVINFSLLSRVIRLPKTVIIKTKNEAKDEELYTIKLDDSKPEQYDLVVSDYSHKLAKIETGKGVLGYCDMTRREQEHDLMITSDIMHYVNILLGGKSSSLVTRTIIWVLFHKNVECCYISKKAYNTLPKFELESLNAAGILDKLIIQ